MSTRRGDGGRRSRPQKHQNSYAFKNDLHDKHTPLIKLITTLNVCEVCERCKEQIDWKIKYRKYKPLTQPGKCNKCSERKVKRAYHVLCRDCALDSKCCAKCLKSSEEVSIVPPAPTTEEKIKLKVEMDQLIKSLPERKRRTFLRYMNRGRKKDTARHGGADDEDYDELRGKNTAEDMPRTREQLMKKFEQLNQAGNEDEDGDDLLSDDDYEGLSDEDFSS